MKLNTTTLNKKYFLAGNVIYKIDSSASGGAISNKDVELNSFIPKITVTKESKVDIDDNGDHWTTIETYFLDSLIEIGDTLEQKTDNTSVKKVDTNKSLVDYFFDLCKKELEDYISKNPSTTFDVISTQNKTNIPSWVFNDYTDSTFTYNLGDLESKKLSLKSIIDATKSKLVSDSLNSFKQKQSDELVKFKENLAKKYLIEVK
jgi:hypothetical protein